MPIMNTTLKVTLSTMVYQIIQFTDYWKINTENYGSLQIMVWPYLIRRIIHSGISTGMMVCLTMNLPMGQLINLILRTNYILVGLKDWTLFIPTNWIPRSFFRR